MFPRNRHSAFRILIGPPKCTTRVYLTGVVSLAIVLTALAYPAQAQEKTGWSRGPEMRLFLADTNPWVIAIHPDSGWQITALMQAKRNELLGIGVPWYPPLFPHSNVTGYLVFDDPDSCPSFLDLGGEIMAYESYYCAGTPTEAYPGCVPPYWPDDAAWPFGLPACAPTDPPAARQDWIAALTESGIGWPKDETWVEFTPGIGVAAIPPFSVADIEEQEPVVWTWGSICDPTCVPGWVKQPYGPDLGSTVDDLRYGNWRRLPGLVVLADHGPGLRTIPPGEYDTSPAADFFDQPQPVEAWNLAGLFNSAAYSLKGSTTETSILAHINVPYGLFTPVVLVDKALTTGREDESGVFCDGTNALYRLDGGPLTCAVGGLSTIDALLNNTVVTLRVFMVEGDAPDVLIDMDWDGDVDIRDAQLMGLTPVSTQSSMRFTQYHELECGFLYDFDGDGDAGGCVFGARPGGLTQPPR
jgi:hypothetical protein